MSSQYGELRPTNSWDWLVSLGHSSKFQRISRLGFITAPTSLNGGQPNFARCLAVSWAGTLYIYILGGSCPLMEFCQVQNSLCGQVSRSPVLAAIMHGTGTLCGVVQGMESRNFRSSSFWTEGATYIPWAAITFGIVPHSSLFCFCAANHIIVIYISQNTTCCLQLIITIDWSEIDRPLCTDGSNNKVFFTESKITTYFDL